MNRGISASSNVRWFDGKLTYVMQHGGHEFYNKSETRYCSRHFGTESAVRNVVA
ncbi:MAG: hypothetical protein ACLURV_02825 [Gallintestinimicrobium sp.]